MTHYFHVLPSSYHNEEYELFRILLSGGFGIVYPGIENTTYNNR